MGRPKGTKKNPPSPAKKDGTESKHHWSKAELLDHAKRELEQQADIAEKKAIVDMMVPPVELPPEQDPFFGLTEQQKLIGRLRIRGLSQSAIGKVVQLSQQAVSQELEKIRIYQEKRGKDVNQAAVVGETSTIYQEVEERAWDLYHNTQDEGIKAKGLALVMQAREKNTKLLMDLGLIKKAAQETKVTVGVSPFLEKLQQTTAPARIAESVIESTFTQLEGPSVDAEYEEILPDLEEDLELEDE